MAKLTIQDYRDICASDKTPNELAEHYGVSRETIRYARKKGAAGKIGYKMPKSERKPHPLQLPEETRMAIASCPLRRKATCEKFGVSSQTVTNCRRAYPELVTRADERRVPVDCSHLRKQPKVVVEVIALKVRQSIK